LAAYRSLGLTAGSFETVGVVASVDAAVVWVPESVDAGVDTGGRYPLCGLSSSQTITADPPECQ